MLCAAGRVSAPGLLLLAPHGTVRLADGWVSPSYGHKEAAPVAVVSATGTDVDLVTVLLPACAEASVTVDCAAGGSGDGDTVTVRVDRPGIGVDTITCGGTQNPVWERSC